MHTSSKSEQKYCVCMCVYASAMCVCICHNVNVNYPSRKECSRKSAEGQTKQLATSRRKEIGARQKTM